VLVIAPVASRASGGLRSRRRFRELPSSNFQALTVRAELLAKLMASQPVLERVGRRIGVPPNQIAAVSPIHDDVRVLGPAEAPLAVVRGRYRFRLLVKAPRGFDLSAYLREWLAAVPKAKGTLKLEVDVDPQSFL